MWSLLGLDPALLPRCLSLLERIERPTYWWEPLLVGIQQHGVVDDQIALGLRKLVSGLLLDVSELLLDVALGLGDPSFVLSLLALLLHFLQEGGEAGILEGVLPLGEVACLRL